VLEASLTRLLEERLADVVRLEVLDLWAAPDEPGIYSWYVEPPVLPSAESTAVQYCEKIAQLSEPLREPDLELVASGRFGNRWQGDLASDGGTLRRALESAPGESTTIGKGLSSESRRMAFAGLLRTAVPRFSAPVYIGVAGNLRKRLNTHGKALLDPELGDGDTEDLKAAKTFAERVKKAGVKEDHLVVYAMTVKLENLNQVEAREVAAAAELVLNGSYRPLFGRR